MFVDTATVYLRAGDGGAGVAAFEKRRGKPKGKPTGGAGGPGGNLILEADPGMGSLLEYQRRPHRRAGSGGHGSGDLRNGPAGDDLVLAVPLGTVVKDEEATVVADLVAPGQRYVAARGGRGGKGNAAFVSPAMRAPGFAEQGEFGEEVTLFLELKLVADAALIGFPNAGKSTLISRVSAARPKVAEYPFTTLQPHLGVVEVGDRQVILADIPGLIEGAAEGKGLGHKFLRHTERAQVLVMLLDGSSMQEDGPSRQRGILAGELERYSAELATRPRLVALNKTDLVEVAGSIEELRSELEREEEHIYFISAATGDGLDELMFAVAAEVDEVRRVAPEREGFVLHRPAPGGFEVERHGGTWVVSGRAAERAVGLDDLTRPEAADYAARRLARIGVNDALDAAGAEAGDDVRIGDIVFEYQPEDEEDE